MSDDTFREDLLTLLFHLRISQLMITIMTQNVHVDTPERRAIKRLSKEVFAKMDWYVGVVNKILQDPDIVQELAVRDDKLANIANISQFVASYQGDLSNEMDLLTNSSWRKELFRDAWTRGAEYMRTPTDYEGFELWYNSIFPNNITSLQTQLHGTDSGQTSQE